MKAVMISGSRNLKGQTARAAGAVLEGLASAGVEHESHYLPQMRIERCRQCDDAGWGICRTEGKCVIEDDFASLVETIRDADVAVFATPVYFGDLSESIRAFLDRLRRTCVRAEGKEGVAGTRAIGVCVAGGGGGGAPHCCVSMERVLSVCGFDLVDLVPVRRQNLDGKLPSLRGIGEAMGRGEYSE